MAEAVSPTRESADLSGGLKFGSKSLPPGPSLNKALFQQHARSHCRPRKDDESSNHLLPKDRRIKAMTLFNSAILSFNADLHNYNKPSKEQLSSVQSSESFFKEEFDGDIEVVSKRVLSRLSDFNETFAEPKLDLHIRFSQEKFNNKVLKIGVFGRLKAGKSTLLNALTHSKLFPTDSSNPETSVIVGLTHKDGIHIGPCTTDEFHGKGMKCPQLQDEKGSILAQGSGEIIKFLEDINKDVRRHGTEQGYLLIKAHIPSLVRCWYKDKQIIIQDTPGLGEADNEQVKKVTENGFHSCSAFLYVVDCSKLSDHLDVTALNLIKQKDRKFFEDGRLLTLANHFDHTFQIQAKSKQLLSDPLKIKTDVREMILQGVHQVILAKNIVPCIAYWAWCARVPEDMDEEDFEYWKRKYLNKVSLPPGFNPIEGSQKFVEDVSGIKTIENWLTTIADNGECLFMRSAISDVMYCVGLCMERCVQFGEHIKDQAVEMGCVMASKADTWNEVTDILTDIENEMEKLKDEIGDAYDEDIQTPVLYLENTAKQQIEAFREKCCRKCAQYALNTEEEEDEYDSDNSDDSNDSDEWIGTGEIEHSGTTVDRDSMDDKEILLSYDNVNTNDHLDSYQNPNAYRLKDFGDDLKAFAQELESQLNSFLATVRFDHIPQAIPLQDFRDNKATLDLCASVFLTGKPSHNQTECPQNKKYAPSSEEIEAIIMHRPLTLNQLRERASITELKLSWITRMMIWFQRKVGRQRLDKSNYILREKDVNSAIQFLTKNNCLKDCSHFLRVDIKEQIVECYYNEYSTYVRNILDEYERTSLAKMEQSSKKMENEMSTLLETHYHNTQRQSYLVRCMSYLESEKTKYMLNMPEEFRDESSGI